MTAHDIIERCAQAAEKCEGPRRYVDDIVAAIRALKSTIPDTGHWCEPEPVAYVELERWNAGLTDSMAYLEFDGMVPLYHAAKETT